MEDQHPSKLHGIVGVHAVRNHQFLFMIAGVIIIALFLVHVALSLYISSGTVQLDLSRPGYDSAREEVTKGTEVFQAFPEDEPIDTEALNEFNRLYKEKAAEALIEIDAFSGDALSDEALSLQ